LYCRHFCLSYGKPNTYPQRYRCHHVCEPIAELKRLFFCRAGFVWNGPLNFVSTAQNPLLANPAVSASGGYTVKVTSAVGCSNSAVAQVSVVALPVVLPANDSPKCFGQNLNLNGSSSLGGTTYLWNGPNGFNSAAINPFIPNASLAAGGVYTLQITTGPCVATNTTAVIVHPLPSPTITGNSPVCETKSLVLTVNAASLTAFQWIGPVAFSDFNQSTGRDSSILAYSGIYTVMVTDVHNCQNSTQYTVSVLQNPTVTATGTTVCLFEPAVLSAKGAVNYYWSLLGVPVSTLANALIPTATSSLPVIYSVMGTAANGCTATAKATLNTLPLPTPSLSVEPKNRLCLNEVITFNGFGGANYVWRGPFNGSFSGQTVTLSINNKSYQGTYTLTVTDEKGCRANAYTPVLVDDLPSGTLLSSNNEACVPFVSDFEFAPSASNSAPVLSSSWLVANKTYTQNQFNYHFVVSGNYPVVGRLVDTNGCVNTLTLMVKAYAKPVADFSYLPETPIENFETVQFNYTGTSSKNQWWYINVPNNKNSSLSGLAPNYLFEKAGAYPVVLMVQNSQGCSDTIIKVVKVLEDFAVYVPNAFTPNRDGNNEQFMPVFRGMQQFNLRVFNRWGELLFESSNTANGWDGSYRGKECKNDVYTYQLEAVSQSGERKQYNGTVTLYR
jgi:gliding motility-associated-like protein